MSPRSNIFCASLE